MLRRVTGSLGRVSIVLVLRNKSGHVCYNVIGMLKGRRLLCVLPGSCSMHPRAFLDGGAVARVTVKLSLLWLCEVCWRGDAEVVGCYAAGWWSVLPASTGVRGPQRRTSG
jgi:hypothetical protein